ncbi:hypothetical protein LguiA_027501 [Lonicera macranthoides]
MVRSLKPNLDFSTISTGARMLESIIMDLGDEMQKASRRYAQSGNLGLLFLWYMLHFMISLWYFALEMANAVQSYLISKGLFKRYKALDPSKVRYLAIVVDSEDANKAAHIIELLNWLAAIGIKRICLYDREGALKKSKEIITELFHQANIAKAVKTGAFLDKNDITLDFASFSDGKEAVAKAANFLFAKYYGGGNQEDHVFTENDMTEALEAVGSAGPDPDLMLIYGPARCHLGFPAWRIRYTEMVHMGPLNSRKYGSLIKAIYRFTMVRQNYGS